MLLASPGSGDTPPSRQRATGVIQALYRIDSGELLASMRLSLHALQHPFSSEEMHCSTVFNPESMSQIGVHCLDLRRACKQTRSCGTGCEGKKSNKRMELMDTGWLLRVTAFAACGVGKSQISRLIPDYSNLLSIAHDFNPAGQPICITGSDQYRVGQAQSQFR